LDKIPQIKLNLDFERIQEKLGKAAKWKQFKERRLDIIQKYMVIKKVVHRGNQLLALRTMHILMQKVAVIYDYVCQRRATERKLTFLRCVAPLKLVRRLRK